MDCGSCAMTIESSMRQLPGVEDATVSFTTETMEISGSVGAAEIEKRLRELGYRIASDTESNPQMVAEHRGLTGFLHFLWEQPPLRTRGAGHCCHARRSVIVPTLGIDSIAGIPALSVLFGAGVLIAGDSRSSQRGFRSLIFARRITIDLLMAIAAIGALAIGETGEAVTVILLFMLGEALEAYSAERARDSLRTLMSLQPQEATVLEAHTDSHEHGHDAGAPQARAMGGETAHHSEHGHEEHGHHEHHDAHAHAGHNHAPGESCSGGHGHSVAAKAVPQAPARSAGHEHEDTPAGQDHSHATHEYHDADHEPVAGHAHAARHDQGHEHEHEHEHEHGAACTGHDHDEHGDNTQADHAAHDHQVIKPVGQVKVGDRVLVRPAQRIPVDGEIIKGISSVNQAPVTGEDIPVLKQVGDEVMAGTVNGEAAIEIRVTRPSSEGTIARIARLVEQAQAQRSPAERFIDRFARYYTPAVVVLAILVVAIPVLAFGQPFLDYGGRHPRLAVPRPDAADHRLPLRAGHQHPGDRGQRADPPRATRGTGKERCPARSDGRCNHRRFRQDRHPDPRQTGRHRYADTRLHTSG